MKIEMDKPRSMGVTSLMYLSDAGDGLGAAAAAPSALEVLAIAGGTALALALIFGRRRARR